MSAPSFSKDFTKLIVLPALSFFLIPLGALGFAAYGQGKIDNEIFESIQTSVGLDTKLSADEKPQVLEFFRGHPASSVCDDLDPRLDRFRESVCKLTGDVSQFIWARRLALALSALGLLAFALLGLLSLWAWAQPSAQHVSFMLGWRALQAISTVEILGQSTLVVWLSFWVTALLFHVYALKLIAIAACVVVVISVGAVAALFKRPLPFAPLDAEVVSEGDAPKLWLRIRELATRVGTTPPDAIVAGIDDNFFVTESGVALSSGAELTGRVLYVSLPLLRVLSPSEADAVFGHELAHFRGGDTEASARLLPALRRYDQYSRAITHSGAFPAAVVLRLFRALFELALQKEHRRRELVADETAARVTSPDDLGRALLKTTGYSSFRNATEGTLFEQEASHAGALNLDARIHAGLASHVASPAFLEAAKTARVPHPFDSHPLFEERVANVKGTIKVDDAATVFSTRPAHTWAHEVLTAEAIEKRLWDAYETQFRKQHELSLAWRYLPSTDAEREHVRQYFPDARFTLKNGESLAIDLFGVTLPTGEKVLFRDMVSAKLVNGYPDQMHVVHLDEEKKKATAKLKVGHLGKEAEAFKATFSQYWQRDQVARQHAAAPKS